MTAFLSFGIFWETLVALLILPKLGLADAPSATAMAAYFAMWGLFTLVMFIGSLKANRALQAVLGLLTVLFFLLAIGEITGNANVVTIAGYEGILTGFVAIYAGLAQVLNEMYKKDRCSTGVNGTPCITRRDSLLFSKNRYVCADEYFAGIRLGLGGRLVVGPGASLHFAAQLLQTEVRVHLYRARRWSQYRASTLTWQLSDIV